VLAWWDEGRAAFDATYRSLDPKQKVPRYGPPMAARSKVTARIMETWAHGQDIRDAFGIVEIPTGRLHHVCHLGVRARTHAFAANDVAVPEGDVHVVLAAPDGGTWEWGAPIAVDVVAGPALDFALLVTQRRHRDDLALRARGPVADRWLDLAQAFAGPRSRAETRSVLRLSELGGGAQHQHARLVDVEAPARSQARSKSSCSI
jgi:uncharacterized protein (TIGR03084 family)